MVRLGMEDRILMVAEDQRSPMRGSPSVSSSSHSTSLRLCLLSFSLRPGLDRPEMYIQAPRPPLQLPQLEGVGRSSALTLLRDQLAERVVDDVLVYWTPDAGTEGQM
ncbi:hypothetical protein EYF80_044647 [Liparis tanakae]|uniref:Uncharacterized protein n=1 Tax=Liparis tanakae TaxID=230148 RepID=A0A4Z2FVZ9_9TELE|nr:hypothetical protein EYF80_044647 [Liparis tanakae]